MIVLTYLSLPFYYWYSWHFCFAWSENSSKEL